MNKKIFAYILIFSIYISSVLQIASLHFQISHLQQKPIKSRFSEDEKLLLKFPLSQVDKLIKWEDAHEFEFNKKMYDVYFRKTKDDTLYLYCYLDDDETQLRNNLEIAYSDLFSGNATFNKKFSKYLEFAKSLFPPDEKDFIEPLHFADYSFISNKFFDSLIIQEIFKPPIHTLS